MSRHQLAINLAPEGSLPPIVHKKTKATAPWQADRGSNP